MLLANTCHIARESRNKTFEAAESSLKHCMSNQAFRTEGDAFFPGQRFRVRDESCMQVLCTTSTLATGVNLPARLVVLKGTRRWCTPTGEAAGYREYERSSCLQMIGRAGRPQFDTQGTAIIMTKAAVSATTSFSHRSQETANWKCILRICGTKPSCTLNP